MHKAEIECARCTAYSRFEVTMVCGQSKLHRFKCNVCWQALEAGVTSSLIAYCLSIYSDLPRSHGRRSFDLRVGFGRAAGKLAALPPPWPMAGGSYRTV
jgi:hypothetical protein